MPRHSLLCCVLLSLLFACSSNLNPPDDPPGKGVMPNIVLLIGDDQGYPYFGFMGADYISTPNMDSLAENGTLFTQGYVPENHCRPSLQALMTGTLPIDYAGRQASIMETEMAKTDFRSEEAMTKWKTDFPFHAMQYFETLPKLLASKGYKSFQGGKWWEFNYQNGGFTHGMTTGWTEEDKKGDDWFLKFMGGQGTELARKTNQPVFDFLEEVSGEPFFIWYAPSLPHYPFDAPQAYYDLYKDKEMTESARQYYANCTWFDDAVGELTEHLKEKGQYENTLFVYVNDNGWEQTPEQEFIDDEMRYHNGGDKGKLSMYDQSFRSPIIFSWPGRVPEGKVRKCLIHSTDIPATILDYAGIPVPEDYFGQSYRTVIENDSAGPREEIIGNIGQTRWEGDMMGRKLEGYWLRNKDWFFNWNATDDVKGLYNMSEDPNNDRNLVEEYPELVDIFTRKITSWKKEKGR